MHNIYAAMIAVAIMVGFAIADTPTTAPTTLATTTVSVSVTGTWGYTIQMDDLHIDAVAELKLDGTTITGNVIAGVDTTGLDVTNGKLTGQDIRFDVDRVSEVGTLRSTYIGKLNGDHIRGTIEVGWIDVPDHPEKSKVDWTATRAKDGTQPPHGVR